MIQTPSNNVYHVRGLEEALTVYARERLEGKPNPTFTVDAADFERIAELAKKSYTIHAKRRDGTTAVLRRVLLHFTPVDAAHERGAPPPKN